MSRTLKEPSCSVEHLFDSLWNQMIKVRLPSAIPLDPEKVLNVFTQEIEKILQDLPYREWLNLHNDVKNNAKVAGIFQQGNVKVRLSVKRYIEALKHYNECIAYAEKGSALRALAYGNRAIICMDIHRYKDCLENIRLARASNCPERMTANLKKLEDSAKRALEKATENKQASGSPAEQVNVPAERELKLNYTAHEHMLQVANCLEMQQNVQYGRHVVTNRPLSPGDVVMIDKPFVTVLDDKLRYVRCAYCHHENTFTLIPCEGCTVAMYCSEECLSEAHRQYHRYECAIIRDMWQISGDIAVIAVRTIALALAVFDHDLEALQEHLDNLDESKVNSFTTKWKVATQKDIFETVHVLSTNQQLRKHKPLALKVFIATIIHQLVMERTELGSICEADGKMKKLLFDLILRYLQLCECNKQWLTFMDLLPAAGIIDTRTYATGCFPLISMLNHSCAPNLRCITLRDGRCAVLVIRPVAEGGQLFVSYGPHHLNLDRKTRRTTLQTLCCFRCCCEACIHKYPPMGSLTISTSMGNGIIKGAAVLHEHGFRDTDMVILWIPALIGYLTMNNRHYPNLGVCHRQVQLVRAYSILYSYTSVHVQIFRSLGLHFRQLQNVFELFPATRNVNNNNTCIHFDRPVRHFSLHSVQRILVSRHNYDCLELTP